MPGLVSPRAIQENLAREWLQRRSHVATERCRRGRALSTRCELVGGALGREAWSGLAAIAQPFRLGHAQMEQPMDLVRLLYHAEAVPGSQHVAPLQWEWYQQWYEWQHQQRCDDRST